MVLMCCGALIHCREGIGVILVVYPVTATVTVTETVTVTAFVTVTVSVTVTVYNPSDCTYPWCAQAEWSQDSQLDCGAGRWEERKAGFKPLQTGIRMRTGGTWQPGLRGARLSSLNMILLSFCLLAAFALRSSRIRACME